MMKVVGRLKVCALTPRISSSDPSKSEFKVRCMVEPEIDAVSRSLIELEQAEANM